MPFIFIIIGVIFVTAGMRGNSQCLLTQLGTDFQGPNNFVYWVLSIGVIGALGYVQDFRAFSRALLALILIVLVVSENQKTGGGGLFVKFEDAIKTITGG